MFMTTIQRLTVAGAIGSPSPLPVAPRARTTRPPTTSAWRRRKKSRSTRRPAFATKEQSNIQASTGDADIRVNIPYELEGKKGLYQCIAAKQTDGTYKVTF